MAGLTGYVSIYTIIFILSALPLTHCSTALGSPVPTSAVAKSILYLASEAWSGHVTGQVLNVDSGKQGKVMWPAPL